MYVSEAIGRALYDLGVRVAFGVVGSGNFHYTNALVEAGARFVAARHEGGAAVMADAHARMSEQVTVLSLHQGCGYTNALTGIVEAAKSQSPLLVLTAEATDPKSNFYIDQESIARGCGAVALRIRSAETAVADLTHAYNVCAMQKRTVVLNIPIDVQDCALTGSISVPHPITRMAPRPQRADVEELAALLEQARKPVFVAGRGARGGGVLRNTPSSSSQTDVEPCWRHLPSPEGCSKGSRGVSTWQEGSRRHSPLSSSRTPTSSSAGDAH